MPTAKTGAGHTRSNRSKKWAVQVTVYIELDVLEKIDELARAAGISRSEWVNEAIKARLKEEEPA